MIWLIKVTKQENRVIGGQKYYQKNNARGFPWVETFMSSE